VNAAHTTTEDRQGDGSGVYYQFGSSVRVGASQPILTTVDTNNDILQKRISTFDRNVMVRIPFILRFQKTITVTTDVNIISTKFNYKTVAAIIQSIQYDTQYFTPPYAKIKIQIRTKSQYPYLFNKDTDTVTLTVGSSVEGSENVALELEHLADDTNCTFTNPDHMREGDVCTQEWMLYITPADNVCYATGEYSITYTAGCFYDKEVCYLPQDVGGADITDVTFTFKIQTSKFCPQVADEVDLSGSLEVTGRESFKPDVEGLEDNTEGSFYMQGERIHFFAQTESTKAKITGTRVIMVEVEQDLGGLVQTGYNRVPYDESLEDVTVWMSSAGKGTVDGARVATGTVAVNDGDNQLTVTIMTDDDVYGSGDPIRENSATTFGAEEAGFKMSLHSRVFPVNVDSFGSKSVIATLEVTYEALETVSSVGRRRRLLTAQPTFDLRSRTDFNLGAWKPASMPDGLGKSASMSLELTLNSPLDIGRANVKLFAQSMHSAIVTSLNEAAVEFKVYDTQVSIDAVYSDGIPIWTRPIQGKMASRRLMDSPQRIRVEFTFANVETANAMPLHTMTEDFNRQLKSPSSSLMLQPVFFGSIVHRVYEITTSSYEPDYYPSDLIDGTSSTTRAVPIIAILLITLWQ